MLISLFQLDFTRMTILIQCIKVETHRQMGIGWVYEATPMAFPTNKVKALNETRVF